jgi:hypothetical protein
VSRALDDFAESLASAQWQMAAVRDQAQQTLASLAGSRAGLQEPTVASGIRAQVLEAARRGAAAIRAAGRTSPTAGQNWFEDGWEKTRRWTSERLDDLKGFMAEHAGALRGLANPAAAFPGPDPPRQPRAVGCRRTWTWSVRSQPGPVLAWTVSRSGSARAPPRPGDVRADRPQRGPAPVPQCLQE